MSEETTAFAADIFINGIKAGYAKNDGHGGCTEYHAHTGHRDLIEQAEEYCLTLPPIVYEADKHMKGFTIDMNLENFIDELVTKHLAGNFEKKLKKNFEKGICYGTMNSYQISSWGKAFPISKMKDHPQGNTTLKKAIDELKAKGETILNTNLKEFGV